jgi:hypothetical protein
MMSRLKSSDSVQLQFLLGSQLRKKNRLNKKQLQDQHHAPNPPLRITSPHQSWSNLDLKDSVVLNIPDNVRKVKSSVQIFE